MTTDHDDEVIAEVGAFYAAAATQAAHPESSRRLRSGFAPQATVEGARRVNVRNECCGRMPTMFRPGQPRPSWR